MESGGDLHDHSDMSHIPLSDDTSIVGLHLPSAVDLVTETINGPVLSDFGNVPVIGNKNIYNFIDKLKEDVIALEEMTSIGTEVTALPTITLDTSVYEATPLKRIITDDVQSQNSKKEAYMEVVKHEKPELKPNDIFRELGYRWKQLTDSEKKLFEMLELKDKQRYELETKMYLEGSYVPNMFPDNTLHINDFPIDFTFFFDQTMPVAVPKELLKVKEVYMGEGSDKIITTTSELLEDLLKKHNNTFTIDIKETSEKPWNKLSSQYHHGSIQIPFQAEGRTAISVSAIWHSYKVFENEGVDPFTFASGWPRIVNKKRGKLQGWGKSFPEDRNKLFTMLEARYEYHYVPYFFQLENYCKEELQQLEAIIEEGKTIIIVDHNVLNDPTEERTEKKDHKLTSSWLLKYYLLLIELNKKKKEDVHTINLSLPPGATEIPLATAFVSSDQVHTIYLSGLPQTQQQLIELTNSTTTTSTTTIISDVETTIENNSVVPF